MAAADRLARSAAAGAHRAWHPCNNLDGRASPAADGGHGCVFTVLARLDPCTVGGGEPGAVFTILGRLDLPAAACEHRSGVPASDLATVARKCRNGCLRARLARAMAVSTSGLDPSHEMPRCSTLSGYFSFLSFSHWCLIRSVQLL